MDPKTNQQTKLNGVVPPKVCPKPNQQKLKPPKKHSTEEEALQSAFNDIKSIKKFNWKINFFIYGIIIVILLFIIIQQNISKKSELMAYYNFQKFSSEEIMITYEKRKEYFIKKAKYIMKDTKSCTFSDDEMNRMLALAFDLSQETHISAYLFLAQSFIESGFNNNAKGSSGEITFVQFMPTTWNEIIGNSGYTNCEKDILFVTRVWFKYTQNLMNYLNDEGKTLLAYNCGVYFLKNCNSKDEIEKFKQKVYGGKESYDSKVLKVYNKYLMMGINDISDK